ncbi:hypothetical protein ACLKA6_015145 [Drosophila palustris]
MDQPLIVRAEYSFMGSNNDELCFQKGDLITVTQREDGGWWEGTLNDKTGWFPSNYVNEYKAQLPLTETIRPPEEIQENRSLVLKDLLDSERAHVAELQGLLENFLEPMQQTQILSQDEYAQLMCNFVEVVHTHEDLLTQIEECNDRVGKLLLGSAPLMKKVHQAYCAAHPKAIVILDKYKDELEKYMERQGAATPGLLVLTTGLSKPFRRLDKYSAMLQELERHMESCHPDRGDTQRSVAVYKDIAATCSATRRQKELELQVLTGPVRNWQGQELSTLGDIIHMGSVAVGADHRDRYFVLFPQTLLILSVSQRMSAFIYEGKLPLTGIIVNRLEDTDAIKNAFEISSPLIDRIVAVCQGPNEANKWVELLNANNPSLPMGIKRQLSNLSNSSIGGQLNAAHLSQHLDARGYCTRFSLCAYYNQLPQHPQQQQLRPFRITLPPSNYPPTAPYANLSAHFARLVKAGRLRTAIVKMLLYPQARQSIDLKRIALRKKRCHKATAKLLRDINANVEETTTTSSQSELERQDAFELPTDSESFEDDYADDDDDDYLRSCNSDPFEYVKFYQNRPADSMCNSTGTFVDHGARQRHSSSINLIKLDSLDADELLVQHELKKESLVIGSRALRALARKSTERNSSVHTSTATINLGGSSITNFVEEDELEDEPPSSMVTHQSATLQQQSSDASSMYGARLGGAFMACENLANMHDDLSLSRGQTKPVNEATAPQLAGSPTERHSMPSIFVGNRFNGGADTEVYVPTWRERHETQNQSVDATILSNEQEDCVHSSSMDLPAACRTAPDQLQAELLYNYEESVKQQDQRVSHKSDSPSTGNARNEPAIRSSSSNELCIEAKGGKRQPSDNQRDSIRRCISYQFLQMNNRPAPATPAPSTTTPGKRDQLHGDCKCRCCENSQCPSPRSSDSGMAGSCTIASPDPPNAECGGGHDVLDHVEPERRFDVCGMFREKFLTPEATQEEVVEVEQPKETEEQQRQLERATSTNPTQFQINTKSIFLASSSMDETTRAAPIHATNELLFSGSCSADQLNEDSGQPRATFRSGMYAHWWKKERLPPEVLRGIASAYNKRLPSTKATSGSKDSNCSLGSICSSCYCSLGASGFSEGAIYCSLCHNCGESTETNTTNTTTTTASTCSNCPVCSGFADVETRIRRPSTAAAAAASRLSAARDAFAAQTSYSSSLDCPICAARVALATQEGKQTEVRRRATRRLDMLLTQITPRPPAPPFKCQLRVASSPNSNFSPHSKSNPGGMCTARMLLPPGSRNQTPPVPMPNSNQQQQQQQLAAGSLASAATAMSQHKRSLSFNHHLSYNQYTHTQPPPHHLHPPQPPSLPSHLGALSHKSSLVPTPNNKTAAPATTESNSQAAIQAAVAAAAAAAASAAAAAPNARKGSTKANWTISCLRPTPPLRPSLLNASSGSGSSGSGGSSNNALASYCSGRRNQPTFEEDALVLRVFEGYCAAYQNSARNTIHSALQPWTPCLPIRGGKLKTSKTFSTSNPQLPFIANATHSVGSSLNAAPAQRYSLTGAGAGGTPTIKDYQRALSEERATRKSLNRLKSGFGSGYDNVCTSPLLPRKNKPSPKLLVAQQGYQQRGGNSSNNTTTIVKPNPGHPGLYDRRLNRSFETASTSHRYAGFGAGYLMNCGGALRTSTLQRSTPQLAAGGERSDDSDVERGMEHGCTALLRNGRNGDGNAGTLDLNPDGTKRQSGSWCCGLENEDMTPTLRQLWTAIKQMQLDMSQIKLQINEERALRADLQQLLMQHLETSSVSSGANTPKC